MVCFGLSLNALQYEREKLDWMDGWMMWMRVVLLEVRVCTGVEVQGGKLRQAR
jgi:hypothetical protein